MELGIIVEVLVSILLSITVWYCYQLNKKLNLFRADEQEFKKLLMEITDATERAQTTIIQLRNLAQSSELEMDQQLKKAHDLEQRIVQQQHVAQHMLQNLSEYSSTIDQLNQALPAAPASAAPIGIKQRVEMAARQARGNSFSDRSRAA